MASSSDSHDRVLEAVDRYELPLQRYARRLLGDFDLAADAVHEALEADDLSPHRFTAYAAAIRTSVENMRKLVYAFYDPNFSFKDLIMRFPEAAPAVTDCLSGDLGRDYTALWAQISEFVDLPQDLPYGAPLLEPVAV
jgi:hypothetical protein